MLTFFYSTINAGKTANLILSAHACSQRDINYLIFVPSIASGRDGFNKVSSRIGIHQDAISVKDTDNLYEMVSTRIITNSVDNRPLQIIFVDEAQFMTVNQIVQLTQICDNYNVKIHAYGLRTDFKGEPFEASKYLLAWADHIKEVETWSENGGEAEKALMNIKIDELGNRVTDGNSVSVGFAYKAVSRSDFNIYKHWNKK